MAIFDATIYTDKPDLVDGMDRIQLWSQRSIDINSFYGITGDKIVVMDAEHARDEDLVKYANRLHEKFPAVRTGVYKAYPERDIWRAVKGNESYRYQLWLEELKLRHVAASRMDIIFPSLYTFYDNPDFLEKFATANLIEALKYGRQVIPFLLPKYHNNSPLELRGTMIEESFWRRQINLCIETTGNCAIWGGWGINEDGTEGALSWDNDSVWYNVVKEFI